MVMKGRKGVGHTSLLSVPLFSERETLMLLPVLFTSTF
jgi:hypothetical protein